MKTTKCAVQTAVDNSQGAVYINLQGLCPDLVDDVLRIEVHTVPVDIDWTHINEQMLSLGFTYQEIDTCYEAFLLKAKTLRLASLLAERMQS
jgi:hypothetical protein